MALVSPACVRPDLMSDEELAARFQGGDEIALDVLMRRYRPMVRSKARSWFLPGADSEDVIQEAMIGVFKAARDFAGDHNVSFGAFAEMCVRRQVITAVKAAGRHKHQALNRYVSISSMGSSEDTDGGVDLLLGADDCDPAAEVTERDHTDRLRNGFEGLLSSLEEDVLTLYTEGWSYAEIGTSVGRHAKAVDNAVQRIRRKLGDHLRAVTPELAPA